MPVSGSILITDVMWTLCGYCHNACYTDVTALFCNVQFIFNTLKFEICCKPTGHNNKKSVYLNYYLLKRDLQVET